MNVRANLTTLAVLATAFSTLGACSVTAPGLGYVGGWDWKVSDETERWAGYKPNGIYELQTDVFLLSIPDRTNGLALVPGMEWDVPPGTVRGPTALSDYQDAPRRWPRVAGVAEEGTRMRATILRSKGNVRAPSIARVYVKARIMAGPHQGKLVDLEALSLYATGLESGRAELVGPNKDFLSRAP